MDNATMLDSYYNNSAKGFTGYEKARKRGLVTGLTALYPLPRKGELIVIRQIDPIKRAYAEEKLEKIQNYITVTGEDKIFLVKGFRLSREVPLDPKNWIILERAFPINDYKEVIRIPTRWIVTGSTVCLKVEENEGEYHIIGRSRDKS